jgi:hypothetical protein
MGQSYSGYLKSVKAVRSVRQIHAITTSICEDPLASAHLKAGERLPDEEAGAGHQSSRCQRSLSRFDLERFPRIA